MVDEGNVNVSKEELYAQLKEFVAETIKQKKSRRPLHTSRRSNYSYYHEVFALEVKQVLDDMIADKKDRIWRLSSYPDLKVSSLYMRIYQGIRYLIENMDPDGIYAKYRLEYMTLTKEKDGVRLSWLRDRLEGRGFKPDIVSDREITHEWKEHVERFIEQSDEKILHLKNLALTIQQVNDLQSSFEGLEGIMSVVTEREIKIVKV